MTVLEFRDAVSKGAQYLLLDDLVLDVTKFKINHPGGKFVIE